MTDKNENLLKSIFLLFGSFVFARFFATFLHEHGHAIAAWATGGKVCRIVFHPFSWSYVNHYSSKPGYENIVTWAGPLFAVFVGLLLLIIVWRWHRPNIMPVLMIGVVACCKDGSYLIISCLANTRGDGATLVKHGTPLVVVVAVGFILFAIGIVLAFTCLGLLGISPRDKTKIRILIIGAGFLPYLIAMLFYYVRYREELNIWLIRILGSVLLVFFFALLSGVVQRRVRWLQHIKTKMVAWSAVIYANVLALVFTFFLFFVLPTCAEMVTHTKYKIVSYDKRSNFVGIAREKPSKFNSIYRKGPYEPKYEIIWRWKGKPGKLQVAHWLFNATFCADTDEIMVFTEGGLLLVSTEGDSSRWLFKEDGISLMPISAVSNDTRRVLVSTKELVDIGGTISPIIRLMALDASSGINRKYELDTYVRTMEFIDNNTALALICIEDKPGSYELMKVTFAEDGNHEFILLSEEGTRHHLVGVLKGKPVFFLDEKKVGLRYDSQNVVFAKPIRHVRASESHIWVIDCDGQIFKVKWNRNRLFMGNCDIESIVGCGTFDDNLWIAFSDGTVTTLGSTSKLGSNNFLEHKY